MCPLYHSNTVASSGVKNVLPAHVVAPLSLYKTAHLNVIACMKKLLSVLLLAIAMHACGGGSDSPTAPSTPPPPPPTRIAGPWTGVLESSNYSAEAIDMELAQVTSTVNGTWAYPRGLAAGNISGTVSQGQFSGNMTFNVFNSNNICSASLG